MGTENWQKASAREIHEARPITKISALQTGANLTFASVVLREEGGNYRRPYTSNRCGEQPYSQARLLVVEEQPGADELSAPDARLAARGHTAPRRGPGGSRGG